MSDYFFDRIYLNNKIILFNNVLKTKFNLLSTKDNFYNYHLYYSIK